MHGVLRVVMEPLLGDMPLVGALSMFFLKKPVSLHLYNMTLVNSVQPVQWNIGGSYNHTAEWINAT